MKEYIILRPDEDRNIVRWYSEEELEEVLDKPEDYGITEFITETKEEDPQYWEEGQAMLLEVKVKKVKTKSVAFRIEKE